MSLRLAVIGGGASGLASSIEAKRQAKKLNIDLSVTVFEHLPKCAKKILATGNGRCNFCNEKISEKNYNGDKELIKSVLGSDFSDTLNFFKSFGILPYFENGRVYPRSEQAASIRDALIKTCEILNVELKTEIDVNEVKNIDNKFIINSEEFDAVILATGGKSQKAQGSDGSGYKLLKSLGHKISDISPALTAVIVDEKGFKDLKGLRIKGNFSLYCGRKPLKEEFGEIQFTENALSGIPVLNLSYLVKSSKNFVAVIDFCNEFSFDEMNNIFYEAIYKTPYFRTEDVLSGLIPQKLSYFIMKRAGIKENTLFGKLSPQYIKLLVSNLKEAEFKICGTRDYDYSQVTCGGADGCDFNPKTLMSKKKNGLFACGELLNVNGDCGGYNLHFAFSSGRLAGASAIKYLNNK